MAIPDNKTPSHSAELAGAGPSALRFDAWTCLLLAILAFAIAVTFSRLAHAGFVDLDDELYVFGNPHVLGGLTPRNIAWACNTREGGIVMPLTWWSLQLDASLSSILAPESPSVTPDALPDAAIYHLHNIVLHVLAAWILFLFLCKATGKRAPSFIIALLWAVHPLRVESVAWVTERKDMLSGIFGFLAMYLYVVWKQRRLATDGWAWPWYFALCAAMGLSLLAKPTFVTLPFVLLLLDFWPLGTMKTWRDIGRLALEKWALFAIAFLASIVATFAARRIHLPPVDHATLISNAILSYVRYLWMHVDFRSLAIFYPFTTLDPKWVAGAAMLLAVITALCLWQIKKRPWLLVGWLWYLGAMLPMIGLVQRGLQAYGDRFTYFPAVGLLLLAAFSIPAPWYDRPRARACVFAVACLLAFILAGISFRQAGYWRDSITLFEHVREVTPPNPVSARSLGVAYFRAGRYEDAIKSYQSAGPGDPDEVPLQVFIAVAYLRLDRPDLAIPYCLTAIELQPQSTATHNTYGLALMAAGRFNEAVSEFEKSLELSPNDARTRQYLQDARARR